MGDDLIRWTIWATLGFYLAAQLVFMCLRAGDWDASSVLGRRARWLWTLAWLAYTLHVVAAFHFFHHWSHNHAFDHTEAQSGFGPGIFVSYIFTLLWTADVAWWWLAPNSFASRPRWIDWLWQTFMLFMVVNGAVIFAEGTNRWLGIGVVLILAIGWENRWRKSFHDDHSTGYDKEEFG